MLECHERIRRFARLAEGLADSEQPLPADAERVRKYFSTSFLQHARDEDESLFPMLRGHDTELDGVMMRLEAEHEPLEQLALEVAAIAGLLSIANDRWADVAPAMRKPAKALIAAAEQHLGLEESLVFPRAKALLSHEQLARLDGEVRARRAQH